MKKFLALSLCFTFAPAAFAADAAADIWKAKCKSCHGEDGRGKTKVGIKEKVADLADAGWQGRHTDEKIRKVISEGSTENTKMKAFKEKLSAEEIDSLVKFIRALKQ